MSHQNWKKPVYISIKLNFKWQHQLIHTYFIHCLTVYLQVNMVYSSYLLFILLLTINNILPLNSRNIPFNNIFNQFEKTPSVINEIQDASKLSQQIKLIKYSCYMLVERFQCPNGWERFGGSCYFFPSTKSMPNRTSQICSHYSNNSQLMKIRHLSEIYYAAYSLKIHDRKGLILEIDPKLLKGKIN